MEKNFNLGARFSQKFGYFTSLDGFILITSFIIDIEDLT